MARYVHGLSYSVHGKRSQKPEILMDCIWCQKCGVYNEKYKPLKEVNGFINPQRERNTECHKCKNKLQTIEKGK